MTISEEKNIDKNNSKDEVFIFPASYGQKRMWFLDQFEPESPYYNIPVAFKIKGKFDIGKFVQTIDFIIDRHESLRTTFSNIKGLPFQVISQKNKIEIPIIKLTNASDINEEVKILATKEARAPFNLATGPLFRVKILEISETENVVLITMHHIISDGWSMGILVNEITLIYSSLMQNKKIDLPMLEIQYADYSEWQNNYLQGEVLENQLRYWKNKLENSNSLLDLPTDRNRKPIYSNNGSAIDRIIQAEIISNVQKIANSENASLFMVLISAFNLLLSRYSGQKEINVGTPIANRVDKETEKIIGLFINTLVINTKFSDDLTFRELLKQVKKTSLEAYEHQDLPFEMLVDVLQPERNMSYSPLFQVMFILQNNPVSTTELDKIEITMLDVDMGTSTSDITYSISLGTNGASCSIEYNIDLFDESIMQRMFDDYESLLKEISSDPNKKISDYKILNENSRKLILEEWNTRNISFKQTHGIHSLFERWAVKTPDAIAVVDELSEINYCDLNKRANQLANYLLSLKLRNDLPIGISQSKTINLLSTVLGILKAGYAYLPLDPTYPSDRLNYMIDDSCIKLLIVDKENADIFSNFSNKIIIDAEPNLQGYSVENPNLSINENDLAYIIYTSGSTGKAKGTMIQHDSLVNIYLGWEKDYRLLTDVKNHLQMASFSFDVFGGDWTRALCSGGKLVLIKREKLLQAEELYQLILSENIEIAEFVPAVLRNLASFVKENSFDLKTFKVLIAGSDIWYVKEYKEFKKLISDNTRLINSFGLTETTIDSTFFDDKELNLPDERLVPIGKPFPNIDLYILDENFNILPIGVKGELYIGGISLARGYYKRPHLTAERFLPNPFSKTSGCRLYRTGDVARYLADGNIEFLGRADNQIKLRGFRIELGEIENALTEHDKIKDAIVLAKDDISGNKKLVAYIIFNNATEIEIDELRDFISEKVPDYMIPSAFIFMDKFPLTPNGKVDRKVLPDPNKEDLQNMIDTDYAEPRNDIETELCKIWEEILSIDKVGIKNNFFLLGGHSLLATQVISRIKSGLEIDLPLRVIFEKPTIEEIAYEIDLLKINKANIYKEIEIESRKTTGIIPLSFAQERLWFLDQLEPNSPFYNIPESYRIKGKINLSVLEKCFNLIIGRHEILRTYFSSDDGSPFQVIREKYEYKLSIVDLSLSSDREQKLKDYIEEEAKTPIPIDRLPLFRITVLKLGEDDHVFLMTIHHIISDDWSTKVIVNELGILYEAISLNYPNPLKSLRIQYADYSIWQRNWLKGDVLKNQLNYWNINLKEIPSLLELPYDYLRPKEQTFNGDFIPFGLSEKISNKINKVAKQEGITTFMLLLSAFKIFLYKLSGQKDIVVGTPNANRNYKEIEDLIGFFVNTLAMRTTFSDQLKVTELFAQIKETTLQAYAHQELPFEYIVDSLKPERDLSHSPIFQVMFVYQTVKGKQAQNSERLSIEPIDSHSKTAKFDLTLFTIDTDENISGAFEFNTDLFEKHTVKRFINYFTSVLRMIIENPELNIGDISLLNDEEQKNQLVKLNSTEVMPLIENFVHIQLSKVSNANKNNSAVFFNGVNYTFRELEEFSNKFANYLIDQNLSSEDIISICLPRSFELIYSLIAVLKTGAAYLPIDPGYPIDRIKYIIDDSNTKLIITNSQFVHLFDADKNNLVIIDEITDTIKSFRDELPKVNIKEDNICYVIYTSGSTGKPKGTLITHKAFVNYLSWALFAYPFTENNGSLVHSTLSFDATITSIYPPLLKGRKIVLMNESNDLDELAKSLRTNDKFSILKITPAHLELLSNLISPEESKEITSAMVIGGENLTSKQIEFWQKYTKSTLLFNEYGPTETVVGCIVYECSKYKGIGSVPIGKVIPNMKIYVLDNNLVQVPYGVIGELYLGGVSLARGYMNKPGITAEKFIPNPFSESEGERIYRTGDLVKIQNDGNLIFIGRIDDQVKVRGYRIELGEVESRLSEILKIKECVADVKEFGENDKRLVAYIVVPVNSVVNTDELKEKLKLVLPDYMIPVNIIAIDKIPLTSNGKVDRKGLPLPIGEKFNTGVEFLPPKTDVEKRLAEIWKEVLILEEVGINNNFFDLGGHSLLVTKLVVRIKSNFNINFPVKDVFAFPTIQSQAYQIEYGKYAANKKLNIPPIVKVDDKQNIPLSFSQSRLWFLDQLDENQSIYNMPMAVKVKGKFEHQIFNEAIDRLADRHEILRTNFTEINGVPRQIVNVKHLIKLDVIDLIGIEILSQNEKINAIKEEEAIRPFKFKTDALIRFKAAILNEYEFVIFFTMHHIISDGWSINILVTEFAHLYLKLLKNENPQLPELKIQYSDYSIWQQKNISGEILNKQITYWKNKLENIPSIITLPTDRKRPLNKTFNGAHISFSLEKKLTSKIESKIKNLQVTPYMFLLGTFQILLSRLSGQRDICVGTPIANRTNVDIEKLIGFFANTIVIRCEINGYSTIEDYFGKIKNTVLESFENQDVPFEKLVEIINPERDLSSTPIFQVLFVIQSNPNFRFGDSSEMLFETLPADSKSTQFDLTLSMDIADDNWEGTFEYNTDLFDRSTILKFIDSYILLLHKLAAHDSKYLFNIQIIDEIKQNSIIKHSIGKSISYNFENVIEKFERILMKYAKKIACEYKDIKITYEELDNSSNEIKKYLILNNYKQEDIIAVALPNSIDLVKWILGIMKAGLVYLPVDPNYPVERIKYILEDSKASALVYPDVFKIEEYLGNNIQGIKSQEILNNVYSIKNQFIPILKDKLAYIIYTSGSTGLPKGVMLNHRGLLNLVENQIKDFSINEESRILQFASISFDASISEIFISLLSGGTLYFADREKLIDLSEIKNILIQKSITTVTLPPSALKILETENLDNLKTIISAGEKLHIDVYNKWNQSRKVINAFGPTESTVGVSSFTPIKINENWQSIPIGNAIDNVSLFVLDEDLNLVSEETIGELYIGGESLARGYINNPKLTAEKFIPNPFAKINGERIYKTGDLARYTKDGYIEYIGRIDDQVKLRGFRIELSEIEIVLKAYENIEDASVIVEGKDERAKIIAFIQNTENSDVDLEKLMIYLNSRLPYYMIPSVFKSISKVPITNNGKVDKKKLKEIYNIGTENAKDFEEPSSDIEIKLAKIWTELLEINKVSVNDNFFEIGGHSLLATQLVSRIKNIFSVEISLKSIFEHSTVRTLSKIIFNNDRINYSNLILRKVERPEFVPLSFAQQRLWFIDKLEPGNPFYNLPFVTKIKGELNLYNIEKSIDYVISRHEILRTVFNSHNGKPYQDIIENSNCDFQIIDFSQKEIEDISKYIHELILKPFDLRNGPLLRVHILQINPSEIIFIMVMHHIISDGWSMSILFNELIMKYNALESNKSIELPELKIQYADYSYWQRKNLTGELLKKHIEFWKTKLFGIPKLLNLPLDYPRPPLQTFNGNTIQFEIENDIVQNINEVNKKYKSTSFMSLLTAFKILLYRYSKQEDIVVGTPIANRNIMEIENLIGLFVNTLAIRSNINNDKSFIDLLIEVREYLLGAYAFQDLPFEMLIDELKVQRDLSHTPIFQIMFVMQNIPFKAHDLNKIQIEAVDVESGLSKFDLQITLIENLESIDGTIEYNTDLFSKNTILRLIESYLQVLKTAFKDSKIKIGKIPILDEEKKNKMLRICNSGYLVNNNLKFAPQIFEENVEKYPNNIALTFEDIQISYKELNKKVNKLSRYLINSGVGPDDLVGLCVERSIEMAIGILAIIKSGGAYVPLDPFYPKERLNFISIDSNPKFVLTTSAQKSIVDEIQASKIYLDTDWETIENESSENQKVQIKPENLAYIVYTSGSTGKPKGVMVTHQNLIRLFSSTDKLFNFNSDDVWTFFHSYAFDFSVWELWGALLYGGKVVIVPYLVSRSPVQFYDCY